MRPRLGTLLCVLLAFPVTGCSDKTRRTGTASSGEPTAAPSTESSAVDIKESTAAPGVKVGRQPQTGSLLLIPEGRGMLVADSTVNTDCKALHKAMVGKTFMSGGAQFRITGLGPSRDPALPATEAVAVEVLLYQRVDKSKSAPPDVTVFPPRSGTDEQQAIRWTAWQRKPVRPSKAMNAAFRHALRSKVRLKDVQFRQLIKVNVVGAATPDLLIVASASYPQCRHDPKKCTFYQGDPQCEHHPDWCDTRDNWWLLLVPEGKTSRSTVIWSGQDESTLWIWNTYDLDGDGVHAFILSIGSNPNESATNWAGSIRDNKLVTRRGH